jgi:hypothetical protein
MADAGGRPETNEINRRGPDETFLHFHQSPIASTCVSCRRRRSPRAADHGPNCKFGGAGNSGSNRTGTQHRHRSDAEDHWRPAPLELEQSAETGEEWKPIADDTAAEAIKKFRVCASGCTSLSSQRRSTGSGLISSLPTSFRPRTATDC